MTSPKLPPERSPRPRLDHDLAALERTSATGVPPLAHTRRALEKRLEARGERRRFRLAALGRHPALVAGAAALALLFVAPISYALVTDGLRLFVNADRDGDAISKDLATQLEVVGFEGDIDVDSDRASFTVDGAMPLLKALARSQSGLQVDYQSQDDLRTMRLEPDQIDRIVEHWEGDEPASEAIVFDFGASEREIIEIGRLAGEGLDEDVWSALSERLDGIDLDTASSEEIERIVEEVLREHAIDVDDDVVITIGSLGE